MPKTIPQLTDATTVGANDELIIHQGGATKRASVTEMLSGSINIKHLGAKGDGFTDDTAAISAAITSVASGQKVCLRFPAGTYVINGALTFADRFVSFDLEYPCSFIGTGTVNGYSLASTNWQFAHRIQDRLFVGRPLDSNDGTLWTNGPSSWSADWLETELGTIAIGGGASSVAQFASFSERGYMAICGASKTSDSPLASSQGTMGVAAFAVSDKVVNSPNVATSYAFYGEARRKGNAGWAHTCEFDAIARSATGTGNAPTPALLTPQEPWQAGPAITGAWFSNSRPEVSDGGDVAVGLMFINNADTRTATQGRYRMGIVFDQKSILGADLTNFASSTNIGNAVALGVGHAIGWWNAAATTAPTSYIVATDSLATGINIDFATSGLLFRQGSSSTLAEILKVTNPDGYWRFSAASATNAAGMVVVSPTSSSRAALISSAGDSGVFLANGNGTSLYAYAYPGAVNYIALSATTAGLGPDIGCIGTDTNIDIRINPKGTGNVRFGTHAATADVAISGFITIKDASGNSRKLAVIS